MQELVDHLVYVTDHPDMIEAAYHTAREATTTYGDQAYKECMNAAYDHADARLRCLTADTVRTHPIAAAPGAAGTGTAAGIAALLDGHRRQDGENDEC